MNSNIKMINDKCSGFALITVMFMLVTLISLIFLTAYISINQQKDATRFFVSQIELRRYKRGLFGRLADSREGEFVSCGGHIDYGIVNHVGMTRCYGVITSKRYCDDRDGKGVSCKRHHYYYHKSGYWYGYRGKRNLYPLPFDDWRENANHRLSDDFGKAITYESHCTWHPCLRTTNDFTMFDSNGNAFIYLKDYVGYSKNEIRLIPLPRATCESHTVDTSKTGYTLHKFEIVGEVRMAITGFKKIAIQTLTGNGWVTKFTTGVVIPPSILTHFPPTEGPYIPSGGSLSASGDTLYLSLTHGMGVE